MFVVCYIVLIFCFVLVVCVSVSVYVIVSDMMIVLYCKLLTINTYGFNCIVLCLSVGYLLPFRYLPPTISVVSFDLFCYMVV